MVSGRAKLSTGEDKIRLGSGEAALAVAGQQVNMKATDDTVIYRASAPVPGT